MPARGRVNRRADGAGQKSAIVSDLREPGKVGLGHGIRRPGIQDFPQEEPGGLPVAGVEVGNGEQEAEPLGPGVEGFEGEKEGAGFGVPGFGEQEPGLVQAEEGVPGVQGQRLVEVSFGTGILGLSEVKAGEVVPGGKVVGVAFQEIGEVGPGPVDAAGGEISGKGTGEGFAGVRGRGEEGASQP